MAGKSEKHTPQDLVRLIFRRWRLFLLAASLFAIVALIGLTFMPVKYTGLAVFERRSDPGAEQLSAGMGESAGFEPYKLTLRHELSGYHAVERAVEELGMTKGMPRGPDGQLSQQGLMAKQQLILALMKQIEVTWEVRADRVDLISVSFTSSDPQLAEDMPNTLVREYIEWVSKTIVETLDASRKFKEKQLENCRSQLEELTAKRLAFEAEHRGMLPEDPGSLQEHIQRITADIDTLRRQHSLAELKLARLEALVKPPDESTDQPTQIVKGPNPELKRLQDQLQNYNDALNDALTLNHMTENHPTVQAIRAKIAQLEETIKNTPPEAVLQTIYGTETNSRQLDAQLAAAQSELDMSTAELERLQSRLAIYQELMDNFGPVRQEYLQMVQRQETLQAETDRWQRGLTDVAMALAAETAMRGTHLNALQLAQQQFVPSFPTLKIVLALAIGGGLAFGAGSVFLANFFDSSVGTTDDADHFDLPILGVIGEIVTPSQNTIRRLKRWILTPAVSLVVLALLGFCALNVVLWLHYPEQYKEWKKSRPAFIMSRISQRSQG